MPRSQVHLYSDGLADHRAQLLNVRSSRRECQKVGHQPIPVAGIHSCRKEARGPRCNSTLSARRKERGRYRDALEMPSGLFHFASHFPFLD